MLVRGQSGTRSGRSEAGAVRPAQTRPHRLADRPPTCGCDRRSLPVENCGCE